MYSLFGAGRLKRQRKLELQTQALIEDTDITAMTKKRKK
jgi:hypothetical protein